MPKVSVIVPVYNAEKYLNKCISSIANQTMKDIEILAVNDGSTDNSLEILDSLSSMYKGKLKVFNKTNGGAGSARNLALEHANGDFIKFVDADDYIDLNILDKMYTVAKENNCKLVRGNMATCIGPFKFSDMCSWNEEKSKGVVDVHENKDYIVTETPGIGNKLISRDLIGDMRFPEVKWEDLSIMPVIVASSDKVFNMDENVLNYRIHSNTTLRDFAFKIPHIFDIVKSLDNLKVQMDKRGLSDEYQEQIEGLYCLHTLFRVENAMNWVNFSHRNKEIVISSLTDVLNIECPNWMSNRFVEAYKKVNPLFNVDMMRLDNYRNGYYENVSKEEAEENINKTFRK